MPPPLLMRSWLPDNLSSMKKLICCTLLVFLMVLLAVASDQEDAAADAVATAFLKARQTAHLSKLERMRGNTFREKVCKRDTRFPSGLIDDVVYETFARADLPEPARRLAAWPDTSKIPARFGIGVCAQSTDQLGRPKYSVLIATYESVWTSFLRIFWE